MHWDWQSIVALAVVAVAVTALLRRAWRVVRGGLSPPSRAADECDICPNCRIGRKR